MRARFRVTLVAGGRRASRGDARARAGTWGGRRVCRGSTAAVLAPGIPPLGVGVGALDGALSPYERLLGAGVEHRATVPARGVEAASLRVGDGRVELLEPLGEDTPVGR